MSDLFDTYLARVGRGLASGDATEHTHRGALVALLDGLAAERGLTLHTTNEPKRRTDCGAPDLVTKRGALPVAWGECKDVGVSLDAAEGSDQMTRYRAALPNLVLTDYLEFRLYVEGEKTPRATARLATADARGRLAPVAGGEDATRALLTDLLTRAPHPITSPEALAAALATRTHLLRDVIARAFERGAASQTLRGLRAAFAQTLLPHLDEADHLGEFVDMYAQTLAYGLFAARVHHDGVPEAFTRRAAAGAIPRTNPLLRKLFESLTGNDLEDEPHEGLVEDLVALLAHTDIDAVLKDFGKRTRQEDPVVHFYETFLREYDPALRELRGVYYTPAPVVSYIVRSVDAILRRDFGVERGLADDKTIAFRTPAGAPDERPQVLVLDPACGTGTFLYHVVDHVRQTFIASDDETWGQYVGEKLLPRLFGFELLMAPYAVAHLKLGLQLAGEDLPAPEDVEAANEASDGPAMPGNVREVYRYDFEKDERLQVYLTNTLEEADKKVQTLFGPYRAISDEAEAAARVKEDRPIMVILGNPPYSNFGSQNAFPWISGLMRDWKPEGEKKWNPDDFMKFMRWAEWRLSETGYGVLAFITSRTYLDGITHRTMRASLMDTFDDVYVLDLHGDIYETPPDGVDDENVFDIRKGVAVGIFVKRPGESEEPATVHHAEVWGDREEKYRFLSEHDVTTAGYEPLADVTRQSCLGDFRFFVPAAFDNIDDYCQGWSVKDMFQTWGVGIETQRDGVAVQFTEGELATVIEGASSLDGEAFRRRFDVGQDGRDWTVATALADVRTGSGQPAPIVYRPFDVRMTWFSGKTKGFQAYPRREVSHHIAAGSNLVLITNRQTRDRVGALVTDSLSNHKSFSAYDKSVLFPLYLYPEDAPADLFAAARTERQPNLTPAFLAALAEATGLRFVPDGTGDLTATVGPEDVLAYAYAVFHSPAFRSRYAEFLRIDFPRLPLTTDPGLFRQLVALGHRLVGLHLLRGVPDADLPAPRTGGKPVTVAEKGSPRYVAPEASDSGRGEVWLNEAQRFEGVAEATWSFQVGGYQPAEKWLKDRRGRTLSHDEITHYRRTLAALAATGPLMDAVDEAIEAAGGFPLP